MFAIKRFEFIQVQHRITEENESTDQGICHNKYQLR